MEKRIVALTGTLLLAISTLTASDLPSSNQGKEAIGLINPSSRFEVDNGWNYFLGVEFLWWIPKEEGLYYAQTGYSGALTSAVPPDGTINFDGHVQKVKPHFRPGFRVSFGGNMSYDEWDILLTWTWYQTHAKGSSSGDLLTLWAHPVATGVGGSLNGASAASAKWSIAFNQIDSELGRSFWVGKHLSLRPFIGIRGAWINQHLDIHYDYTTTPVTDGTLRANSNFQGVGARVGLDMRFALFGGWSFYSIASGSMLYGFYDCHFHEDWNAARVANTSDSFRAPASTAQLALGVRWDTYVHRNRYHFGLYAGWEQNIWFGINKMNHFFHSLSDGSLQQMNTDLTLSGGTFGVRFDF